MPITKDDILSVLETCQSKAVNGFTTREFAEEMGCCVPVARNKVRRLIEEKKVRLAGTRWENRMDGKPNKVPVYELT